MSSATLNHPDVSLRYYLLIPHPEQAAVLVVPEQGGWTLPVFVPDESHYSVVWHINRAAHHLTGLDLATLHCFRTIYHAPSRTAIRYYAMDNIDNIAQLPPGMFWVTEQELVNTFSSSPEHVQIIRAWFNWLAQEDQAKRRSPWAKRGWFAEVEDWMIDLADRLDMKPEGNVIQERAWARASTLHLQTDSDPLLFKAVLPVLSYEPVITRVLYLRYRRHIPEVLAVNVSRAWLLLRGFDATPLSQNQQFAIWEHVLRVFATIQFDIKDNTHSLIALGVPDRNMDYLVSQTDRLLADLPDDITAQEARQIEVMLPRLRNFCYDLMDYELPLTLTHGNLWSGNVRLRSNGQPIFYDWSDCAITHPFFDVPRFLSHIEQELPGIPQVRERLIRAYLQPWTPLMDMATLRHAYALAEVLGYLHRITLLRDFILPVVDETGRPELTPMLPDLFRQLLSAMKNYNF